MRRVLIIVNTYYQLIVAVQLRKTLMFKDYVCILISDHSMNAQNIVKRIKNGDLFDECHFIETNIFRKPLSRVQNIIDCFDCSFRSKNRYSFLLEQLENKYFDELVAQRIDTVIDGLYAYLYRYNSKILISQYEEGLLSYKGGYLRYNRNLRIDMLRKMLFKGNVGEAIKNYYCFYPELYEGKLNSVMIPPLSGNLDIAKNLQDIFNINAECYNFKEKYIYFTGTQDFEGGKSIGEYELVCKVADLVGKENMLVKIHPRDSRRIFVENGFNVYKNSSIPWEAIQLSGNFKDKVFLSTTSASLLSVSTLTKYPIKTYYLYNLCNISDNTFAQRSVNDIRTLITRDSMRDIFKEVYVVDRVEEILN